MLEIPEITFSRMLDEEPFVFRPLYFAMNWEVYLVRDRFEFDGFRFNAGMVVEFVGVPVVRVHDGQESFLAHLQESEMDLPMELKLSLSLSTDSIESALSKKSD
jgi:hypothetical protein